MSEYGAFWVFGGCLVAVFFFCLLFVPETKGKSLDEIQQVVLLANFEKCPQYFECV